MAINEIDLNLRPPEEVREELRVAEHFGREHFLAFAQVCVPNTRSNDNLIKSAFFYMVAPHLYPHASKYDVMRPYGLEVVDRREVGMGQVPEFAKYEAYHSGGRQLQQQAIVAKSIVRFIDLIDERGVPKGFGKARVDLVAGMVADRRLDEKMS